MKAADSNPVELFYKRHMSSDNPIPQIIVVGILRVLLTTCPNAARNSGMYPFSITLGAIDLHSEWSSCISFLHHNKEFFIERQFRSAHFNHDLDVEELPDFATLDEFKFESDRHRVIVALLIADFFLFLMKHLKFNHVIQFIYVS
jgi:hypothetical protein